LFLTSVNVPLKTKAMPKKKILKINQGKKKGKSMPRLFFPWFILRIFFLGIAFVFKGTLTEVFSNHGVYRIQV
jgi:hypothetical protein